MGASERLTLYEIGDELTAIADQLVENDGVLTPELEDRLNRWQRAFEEKVESCGLIHQRLTHMANVARAESKRLKQRARRKKKAAESLQKYIKTQLQQICQSEVETSRMKIQLRQNSRPSIRSVVSVEELPERFVRTTPPAQEVDRKEAYRAWKDDELPEQYFEVKHGSHVRFY